jgi:alpha-glucosidase
MVDPYTASPGPLQSFTRDERTLLLDCGGPRIALTVLTANIVRIRLATNGAFAPRRSWAVTPPDEHFAVPSFTLEESASMLTLRTEALAIQIERATCRIACVDPNGDTFCADAAGLRWGSDGISCAKRIADGEHFYGFGERTGTLDKLGRRMVNWATDPPPLGHNPGTDPLYIAIPVFMAVRPGLAYGVFFNNTWRSTFDIGASQAEVWQMQADGGEIDYYVIYGPTPAKVSEGIAALLGAMPMPPYWALGYHQSRWSYETDAAVRDLATEFRQRDIPCDVIHLDIDYMDGYRVFTWNSSGFPDPAGMIADLRKQGFRTVTIIDPGVKVDPSYAVYQQGLERDCFIHRSNGEVFQGYVWPDDSAFPDFMRPEVRQWWVDMQKGLIDQGVSGIWNDMNEPTVFAKPFSEGGGQAFTVDLDAPQGPADERTTHAEVHNLYGSNMARASFEGLYRDLNGERPFVLTRSAFAGIQRWSTCWMGDNSSWWEHLEMAMPQLLGMGLSGVPFVGVDIGGFFGNARGELFARWMQLGILFPFCRGHSSIDTTQHEPWVFGPRVEAICRDYLKLRYRLLPYLYTLFWEAAQCGAPILRPLFFHFPDDQATYHVHDQVLLGPTLLAAPVYHPEREYRYVYLPAGVWYDWWTDEAINGPIHMLAHAPLERMPLYVRAGAIIPSGPELRFTGERPLDPLTLDLYPGEGDFMLYEDDGHSFAYQQGQFCTTRYTLRQDGQYLIFAIGARTGAYAPPQRNIVLRFHGTDAAAMADHPAAQYDAERRILTLQFADKGAVQEIRVRTIRT